MPTKKVVKKVVAKKNVKKAKVTRPTVARVAEVSAAVVSEVFTTAPETRATVEVPTNTAALFVNGTSKGTVDTTGKKLVDFVKYHAERAGIRSFSVYVNGAKADTADGGKAMTGMAKVEIVTKDARG